MQCSAGCCLSRRFLHCRKQSSMFVVAADHHQCSSGFCQGLQLPYGLLCGFYNIVTFCSGCMTPLLTSCIMHSQTECACGHPAVLVCCLCSIVSARSGALIAGPVTDIVLHSYRHHSCASCCLKLLKRWVWRSPQLFLQHSQQAAKHYLEVPISSLASNGTQLRQRS